MGALPFHALGAFLPSSIALCWSLFLLPSSGKGAFFTLLSLPMTGCQTPGKSQALSASLPQMLAEERCFPASQAEQHQPPVLFADVDMARFSIPCVLKLGFNPKAAGEAACGHVQPLALS